MQKLAEICIKRPVFATMLVMALVVTGLAAYFRLGVDLFPKVDFPIVTVQTVLKGAAPEEVETQVSKRIEEAVNTISGIDDLRSTSAEGVSIVAIQFVLEKDPDVAAQEVRDKISQVLSQLPKDVDPPVVQKLATDAQPIINIVVASGRDLRETTKSVDDRIKKNIESLEGVGEVRFVGDRQRQIQVHLDGQKLYSYNLNIDQVRAALAAQNVEIPGGRVDQGQRELSLRTLGRVEQPKDFERIVVANVGGTPVRISDIARVTDGVEEPRSEARLDGTPAVVLEVRKQAGTNTLQVINNVKDRVTQLLRGLPPDYKVTYTRDQSRFISDSFKAVQEHLLLGGIFAGFVVLLFIRSWRSTIIAALAIPTSIIATYTLMKMMDFTLNQMTMLALVLTVGIVIDDAIVVLENIFKFAEEKGMGPIEAALHGTRDIGLAVLATTLSLIIIFIPVALMSGIVGHFMSSFGYTAAFAIGVSLIVSFTLTPMLCSRFLKPSHNGGATKDTVVFRAFAAPYRGMLHWSMSHRWVIVILALAVMFSCVPLFKATGVSFIPEDDQNEFEVTVRTPPGSSLQGTDQVMGQLEADIKTLPGIRNLLTTVGADVRRQVDRGSILVELIPMEERKETQTEIMAMTRKKLAKYRDLTIGVQPPAIIQGGGADHELMYFLQGPDLAKLNQYADVLLTRLKQVPGVTDLESSYEAGKPELRVRINRDKAADLNVNVASVATALRTLVGGDQQVTTYREGDDRYDVMLRVDQQFRNSAAALDMLFVPSATLGNVPISNVAKLEPADGPVQIERYNRQRQIMISGNIVAPQSLSEVIKIIDGTLKDMNLPADYRSGAVGRSKELGRAAANFGFALVLSLVFMYMILAAQFESFIDPVTILISLPLSVPFALLSLLIMGSNFSIVYTSLGILVLFGIVKKNSILQVDHIKSLRREGMPRLDAIIHGCEDRLRPILMTTAALVAGMIPMAVGTGAGSGSRRTVAIVVIGGQSLCLLLTLLVTPVAYSIFDDIAERFKKLFGFQAPSLKTVRTTTTTLLVLLALALAPAAFAQKPVPAAMDAPARVGVSVAERKLTLKQAIEMALTNNLDIEIERTNSATASQLVRAANGAFDPIFRYQPGLQSNNSPTASILQGVGGKLSEKYFTNNFTFLQSLPWQGEQFSVTFTNSRVNSTNAFASLNPLFSSQLNILFTQPLLRNRLVDQQRSQILIRRKQLDISDVDYEARVIDVIARVEQAYWDVVAARQDVEVTSYAVELAKEQHSRNQRMVDSGTLAPVELAASRAELERRLDNYYASVGALTEIENNLKTLVAPDRSAEIWGDQIIPTDSKTGSAAEIDDLREAVATAIRQRPELKSLKLRKESNAIDQKSAANQVKPQVNVVGGYVSSGLGGALRSGGDPISASQTALYQRINQLSAAQGLDPLTGGSFGSLPASLVGGYGTALSGLFGGNYQSLQVGLSLDFTGRNRTAEAQLATTAISEKRLKLEQARAEQLIEAQVRNSMQAIRTARQRINAAQASEAAAKEKLDSETRLYQTGESTNFFVLTRQNEYLDARRRAVVAQLDFNKAMARLEQALGSTLSTHNVAIK
ncbi:MAG: efflux RND transporter permease subunit [Acidobacteria bacterium]|nr:efflux RND transporter permease subunit [Acidobacteriota bacterium]